MSETKIEHVLDRAKAWLADSFDEATRSEVERLIAEGGETLAESFYTDLEFGTGGLRGIMGAGTNRMNAYTVGQATQGFASYLRKVFGEGDHGVAIAYDCRKNSRFFSEVAADVFASNGFTVYLFNELRPTPILSYAVRKQSCVGGIVVTASHNPPTYNGYKVYWNDGAQVTAPHDQGIIDHVRAISDFSQVKRGLNATNIRPLGREMDEAYLKDICSNVLASEEIQKAADLPIVFTSLHGTGETLVPEALRRIGFNRVRSVAAQAAPDGDFPTVESPNPEEAEALNMAIEEAKTQQAELVLGTDPDGDRVGLAVRERNGTYTLLNGNDTGALLVWYQLMQLEKNGELPSHGYVAKTIVTSNLFADIAHGFGLPCYETLTGFKHIARLIADKEPEEKFITGGEESYGYMIGDFVRDKDGVAASCMVAELVAWGFNRGLTVPEMLQKVHEQYGLYREALVSVKKEGISGVAAIRELMKGYRENPPNELAGLKVLAVRDYLSGERNDLVTGKRSALEIDRSNVIQLELEGGALVTARPSGTEPKIKYYFSVWNHSKTRDYDERKAACEALLGRLKLAFLER